MQDRMARMLKGIGSQPKITDFFGKSSSEKHTTKKTAAKKIVSSGSEGEMDHSKGDIFAMSDSEDEPAKARPPRRALSKSSSAVPSDDEGARPVPKKAAPKKAPVKKATKAKAAVDSNSDVELVEVAPKKKIAPSNPKKVTAKIQDSDDENKVPKALPKRRAAPIKIVIESDGEDEAEESFAADMDSASEENDYSEASDE